MILMLDDEGSAAARGRGAVAGHGLGEGAISMGNRVGQKGPGIEGIEGGIQHRPLRDPRGPSGPPMEEFFLYFHCCFT